MGASGDFHLHSTASDGVHSPTWVVQRAAANGVRVLALTDHDTTNGLEEAAAAAELTGVRLIPGLELSSDYGKADVHLLSYGVDMQSARLQDFLAWQREGRIGRARTMVDRLRGHGLELDLARVFEIAGEATVGRPHVARALLERGYVSSVQEAFDLWLGDGLPGDVDRPKLDPAEAIALIHETGGVVFAAHAIYIGDDYPAVIEALAASCLDGLETYYKHYDRETIHLHEELSARLGLARSGGSDYHGLGNPDDRDIGDIPFSDEQVGEFLAFLEKAGIKSAAGASA